MVHEIRRRWRVAATTLLALALLVPAWQPAAADQVIHTVQPGENLYRIGLHYGVSWLEIVEANQLTSTVIYAGQQLVIPVASTPAETPPAQPTTPAPTPEPTPPPADQPPASTPANGTYTVKPGDYLSRIAQQFGVSTAALAAINNLTNPSRIYPGRCSSSRAAASPYPPRPRPPAATSRSWSISPSSACTSTRMAACSGPLSSRPASLGAKPGRAPTRC